MFDYFHDYCRESNLNMDQLLSLGRWNPNDNQERFSMAILALNTSAYRNTVSQLHRIVSQEMWHNLWPELPVWEVPITNITNGTLRVQSTSNTNMGGLLLNGASQTIGANLIFGDTTINSGLSTVPANSARVLPRPSSRKFTNAPKRPRRWLCPSTSPAIFACPT